MSNFKGKIGSSMIIEKPIKKNKKLKQNEKYNSAKCKCPNCKNSVMKYMKVIDNKKYCLKCFINYNKKIEMI